MGYRNTIIAGFDPRKVPTLPIVLDRSHPLARGLALSIVPGSRRGAVDFVNGIAPVVTGAGYVAAGARGPGYATNINGVLGYAQAVAPPVFSMEVLVQAGTPGTRNEFICGWDSAAAGGGGLNDRSITGFGAGATGSFEGYIFPGSSVTVVGGTTFFAGLISHVVLTSDGTTLALYVNGVSVASTAAGNAYGGYSNPSYFVVGGTDRTGWWWSGTIQLANVATVAWTPTEISARYAEPFAMFRPIVRRQYFVGTAGGTSFTATPGAGAVTLTGLQPTVAAAAALTPGAGSIAFAGLAPTVAASAVATPGVGSIALTGRVPTVAAAAALAPGVGTVTFTGQQPAVSAGGSVTVTPGVGSVVFGGQAPLVAAGVAVSPGVGAIIYTGAAPTVAAGANVAAAPGAGSIVVTGLAPVVAPSGINLTPGTGHIAFTGHVPTGGFTPVVIGVTLPIGRPVAQEYMPDEVAHRRQLARTVNLAMSGKTNTTLFVTLTPSAATTPVVDSRISLQTCVTLHPQTANAAAALPTTYTVCAAGLATINHANNGQTDRTFTMGIHG